MPSFAAAAADCLVWLDWVAPWVTIAVAPTAFASAIK